jgi:hypothetical protein
VHAFEARKAFINSTRHGEANADVAAASIAISAEDDAIGAELPHMPGNCVRRSRASVQRPWASMSSATWAPRAVTHSTVPFPQAAYLKRIEGLASDCEARICRSLPDTASRAEVATAVQHFLQHDQRFSVVAYGRSNLPEASVVDHGVLSLCCNASTVTASDDCHISSMRTMKHCRGARQHGNMSAQAYARSWARSWRAHASNRRAQHAERAASRDRTMCAVALTTRIPQWQSGSALDRAHHGNVGGCVRCVHA